jgi:1-hydroxycarotenoid 3,4-desaturase
VRTESVVIVGAGIGGLVAALELAHRGIAVTVLEAAAEPGGKMRRVDTAAGPLDAGPTVFTLRGIFDGLFDAVGESLNEQVTLTRLDILARHAWREGEVLDLHADAARSAEAIGAFAGAAAADGFRRFAADSRRIFGLLDASFMQAPRPSLVGLAAGLGLSGLAIRPFETLWQALGGYFDDPRLRQLFGRYATYCGSSPFQAPATLMLVAHAEQAGVWTIRGGMQQLARVVARLAAARGARFRYGAAVESILMAGGEAAGVRLVGGEEIAADVVVWNGDAGALRRGLAGSAAARAVPPADPGARSLSAVTWGLAATAIGFPLAHHTVFFSADYRAEFDAIMAEGRLPDAPTVYLCAQDRAEGEAPPIGPERILCLVNAPPAAETGRPDDEEIARCEAAMMERLRRSGLTLDTASRTVTGPRDFGRLFPGTGGALYGLATHGTMASFRRPGSRTAIPRLVLAGGSVHPGPGVPMAAISGRLAARTVMEDLTSRRVSGRTAMRGGMSTR